MRGPGVLLGASVVVVGGGPTVGPSRAGRGPPIAIAVETGVSGDATGRLWSRQRRSRPSNGGHPSLRPGVEVRHLEPLGGVDQPGRGGAGDAGSAKERSHARIAYLIRMGSRHVGGVE